MRVAFLDSSTPRPWLFQEMLTNRASCSRRIMGAPDALHEACMSSRRGSDQYWVMEI